MEIDEPFKLTCTAEGVPTPRIEWFHDDTGRTWTPVDGVLDIESAADSDTGEYR